MYDSMKAYIYYKTSIKRFDKTRLSLIKLAWVILFFGSLNLSQRTADDILDKAITPEVFHRMLSITIVTVILFILLLMQCPNNFLKGIIPSALLLFSLWRILSTFWSSNPLWTFYRSMEYLVTICLLIITIRSMKNLTHLSKWSNTVWIWVGLLVLSVYVGAIINPAEALKPFPGAVLPYALNGVFPRIHNTAFAEYGGIIALVGLSRIFDNKKNRIVSLLIFIGGLVTIVLAQGRAAIIGLLVGISIILFFHRKIALLWSLVIVLLTLSLFWPSIFEILGIYYFRGQTYDQFLSLSTRLDWWLKVLDQLIAPRLIEGYGAFAGGRILAPILLGAVNTRITLDNAWLEILLDTGVVGMILFSIPVIYAYYILLTKAIKGPIRQRYLAIEVLAILTTLLIRSFFVSTITLQLAFPLFVCLGTAELLGKYYYKKAVGS